MVFDFLFFILLIFIYFELFFLGKEPFENHSDLKKFVVTKLIF